MSSPKNNRYKFLQSPLFQNSAWGIASNILQIIFVCAFFAIVARKYHADQFARFLISTTVYQIIAAFSSMGLGQWFIRQYVSEAEKTAFTGKFLKIQIGLGFLFYVASIALAFVIYPDPQIRTLCFILGTNIIFDNCINAIRSLNIAENRQKKTASILVLDGFLKLVIGCLLFITPFSIILLATLMTVARVLTLGLFIRIGSAGSISLRYLVKAKISYEDLKVLIIKNWQFMIIGSISIIYWKMGNIIISKTLSLRNVADYEIAFRVFSVIQIFPIVASSTIYPQFIRYYNEKNFAKLKNLYRDIFIFYTIFGIGSYAFMYSFSGQLIPLAFGKGYPGAVACSQQMFLTFLVLPTVLLQANLIVATGLEKLDMLFNILSLAVNITCCFIGLYFIKDLAVVNYSVFFSFVVFHISQDVILIRKKLMTISHCLLFYLSILSAVLIYQYLSVSHNAYILFLSFAAMLILIYFTIILFQRKRFGISRSKPLIC